ncbi:MAG: hypothetical protein J6Q81_05570, partial [Lentisphaeria bacterium]|nr:hypothetical protein [Lentisphaeria bacterium]
MYSTPERHATAANINCAPWNCAIPITPAHRICVTFRTVFGVSDDGIHCEMSPETIRVHYKGEILPWICDAR